MASDGGAAEGGEHQVARHHQRMPPLPDRLQRGVDHPRAVDRGDRARRGEQAERCVAAPRAREHRRGRTARSGTKVTIAATPSRDSQEERHWLSARQARSGRPRCAVEESRPDRDQEHARGRGAIRPKARALRHQAERPQQAEPEQHAVAGAGGGGEEDDGGSAGSSREHLVHPAQQRVLDVHRRRRVLVGTGIDGGLLRGGR